MRRFFHTDDVNGNRITQGEVDSTGTTGLTSFGHDKLNRLTSAAYPAGYGSWTWQYDPVGNRLTQTAPSGTTNYSYDANNRLITAGSVNYSYDANGNLTSTSAGQSFAWDVFNRMTSATGPGGTATYTYNGDGLNWPLAERAQFEIIHQGNEVFVAFGLGVGFQSLGASFTIGFGKVKHGDWYIALGGTLAVPGTPGFAFQIGTLLGCTSNCHFH